MSICLLTAGSSLRSDWIAPGFTQSHLESSEDRHHGASLSNLCHCLFLPVGKSVSSCPLWSSVLSNYACCLAFSALHHCEGPGSIYSMTSAQVLGICCHTPWSCVLQSWSLSLSSRVKAFRPFQPADPSGPFPQSCSPVRQSPACGIERASCMPEVGLAVCPCWISLTEPLITGDITNGGQEDLQGRHDSSLPGGWAPHPAWHRSYSKEQNAKILLVDLHQSKTETQRYEAKTPLRRQTRWQQGCSVPCGICQRWALATFRPGQAHSVLRETEEPIRAVPHGICTLSEKTWTKPSNQHRFRDCCMTEIKGRMRTLKGLREYPNL